MDLFQETEKLKIRFASAYGKLLEQGKITDAEFDEILEILDNLDSYSRQELEEKLGRFRERLSS